VTFTPTAAQPYQGHLRVPFESPDIKP
jgi:hypothetical protein